MEGINETLAISKGWLCNRQGFPVKYDFRGSGAEAERKRSGSGIGDFIGNPQGLTLQDYSESHRIFAGVSLMSSVREKQVS